MTTNPFGFNFDGESVVRTMTGAAAPVVEPDPEPRPEPPARGAVVRWTEYDQYDELNPQKVRYGVVIEHTEDGAALVLQLGEIRDAAHFAPGTAQSGAQEPVVKNLTRVS
ncbi:hypothetical protein ACFV0D_12540 [Streptomyces sp. NPDC059556]|uniref:hypothetical protein n=1 Tax=Streptomyces sp. NPDC059556 TaxID=3346863 RepID=UPI0036CECA11